MNWKMLTAVNHFQWETDSCACIELSCNTSEIAAENELEDVAAVGFYHSEVLSLN